MSEIANDDMLPADGSHDPEIASAPISAINHGDGTCYRVSSCAYGSSTQEKTTSWLGRRSASPKGNGETKDVNFVVESTDGVDSSSLQTQSLEEDERKARVDAMWEKMNKGVSVKTLRAISNKNVLTGTKDTRKASPQKNSSSLMTYLGLEKKTGCSNQFEKGKQHSQTQNETSDEAKRLAAAAIATVKDASALASASSKGKVEIREVRDFASQYVEIKKLVDANSKEASEKTKVNSGPVSAVDAVLEQIKKKQKLSVLDKTKKDWGEYKEEHKGVEDELDTYKKSSNQYIDKLSFLQRADYREFERERDARLATHATKRKSDDMQEDDDDHPGYISVVFSTRREI